MSNILHVSFGGLRERKTAPLYQYDYGQVLRITGIDLPGAYEVHFSRTQNGEAKTQIGTEDGVLIPDEYLTASGTIYAWLYLHTGTDDGETEYVMQIPVLPRSRPVPDEPTPVEQSTITQAIAVLQAADGRAETAADAAEASATAAAQSEANANESKIAAAKSEAISSASATAAASSAAAAAQSATFANGAADAAEISADRAEQAATNAGYMDIKINGAGHLIYTRTDAVDVDFSLTQSGHLIMEGI